MAVFLKQAEQYDCLAFGDLFLEDVRDYRIDMLKGYDLEPVFPIWNPNTKLVAQQMVNAGLRAELTCVDPRKIDRSFVQRQFSPSFLQDLPNDVDPCGENGEFHTFCFDGPIFSKPVLFNVGEIIHRSYPAPNKTNKNESYGFWFCDLVVKAK